MSLERKALKKISSYMLKKTKTEISSVSVINTYIGQMISHDIVPPTSKLSSFRDVTPQLNLDSIYGNSPLYFYEFAPEKTYFLDSDGKFFLRKISDSKYDVKRKAVTLRGRDVHIPQIPEQRNADNTIILQLHIFWQLFHNYLIEKKYVHSALEARKYTTLLFQIVVIEDFLKQVLDVGVFNKLFNENKSYINTDFQEIPYYFRFASFRFGHSMVRQKYVINDGNPFGVNLQEIFVRNKKLRAVEVINWSMFNSGKALSIDTKVTLPLGTVPTRLGKKMQNVPLFNLLAAKNNAISSGAGFLNELFLQDNKNEIIDELGIWYLSDFGSDDLKHVNGVTIQNLPLWPYLLLESKVKNKGSKLGPLGSLMNAEVIRKAIKTSEFSVYKNNKYNLEKILKKLGKFGGVISKHRNRNRKNDKLIIQMLIDIVEKKEDESD